MSQKSVLSFLRFSYFVLQMFRIFAQSQLLQMNGEIERGQEQKIWVFVKNINYESNKQTLGYLTYVYSRYSVKQDFKHLRYERPQKISEQKNTQRKNS